MVNLATFHPI